MEESISRSRFIRLGAALGVGAAGASVLAACGGSGGSGGGNGGGDSGSADETSAQGRGSTSGERVERGQAIAKETGVKPNSALPFTDAESGDPAVLVHLDSGDFVAYSAVCTHQQCTVAYRDGQLACPCHGSVFDPANGGAVVTPPAREPLPEIPVEVRGGEVLRA